MVARAKNPANLQSNNPTMILRAVLANEKLALAMVSANALLEGIHRFVIKYQPEFSFLLTLIQITVGVFTIVHFIKKWIKAWKHKHEIPTPDSP